MNPRELLEELCRQSALSHDSCEALFSAVMAGQIEPIMLAALLTALKAKGETPDEIAGAALAMRRAAAPFDTGDLETADSCGTGGDGAQTVNISTAAALVAASGGVKVAKHGNRSISSRCGSADVLEQCGIQIEAPAALSLRCLEELNICFLFAPQYHAGVRHAMPVRRALGVRTMFNLLGPLANPALPQIQLMGVYDPTLCQALATTLKLLGCRSALVVHGGGLDEIAVHDETRAAWLSDGAVVALTITPEDVGLARYDLASLRGDDPSANARWLQELLAGRGSDPHNAAVSINAGALLWLAGKAESHRQGVEAAMALLKAGRPAETLARWAQRSETSKELPDGP